MSDSVDNLEGSKKLLGSGMFGLALKKWRAPDTLREEFSGHATEAVHEGI
ncbi:hypothetical protein KBA01_28410 [Kozakia baliensis]|nr:hypothetical protein KBA01_28410 [Kozakia baliensis]